MKEQTRMVKLPKRQTLIGKVLLIVIAFEGSTYLAVMCLSHEFFLHLRGF